MLVDLKADLHCHSSASDGLNSPADNIKLAKQAGLKVLAITDHDSVAGIEEALEASKIYDIEVVPGIELSTVDRGQDIHILGYYIDYKNKDFLNTLKQLIGVREKRNTLMLERLNELGIQITMGEVLAKIRRKGANVGRPHIAEVLMDKGIINSMEEAFDIYLGRDGKAYVNPIRITPEEGIEIIKKAGGVPVLAHPGLYDNDDLVVRLIAYGLAGIEVFHPDHDEKVEKKYLAMAKSYNILATAGSDFHGSRGEEMFHAPIGTKTVPYEIVTKIKKLAHK